ncbi:hypothetical protein [Marinifilum fragile]|uniref:hypothetical protein n=1 Tax=Marinifilum fragile TaxID=570161 RepID=UPI002AA70F78|nr:hypothetical protein [Marinifilum fragile]
MVKVRIPRNEDQLLGLLGKINERHEYNKKKSLLNGAVDMDRLVEKSKKIRKIKDLESEPSAKKQSVDHSKSNDLKFISSEIRSIRNLLLAVYPDEPKVIKEWGFELKE